MPLPQIQVLDVNQPMQNYLSGRARQRDEGIQNTLMRQQQEDRQRQMQRQDVTQGREDVQFGQQQEDRVLKNAAMKLKSNEAMQESLRQGLIALDENAPDFQAQKEALIDSAGQMMFQSQAFEPDEITAFQKYMMLTGTPEFVKTRKTELGVYPKAKEPAQPTDFELYQQDPEAYEKWKAAGKGKEGETSKESFEKEQKLRKEYLTSAGEFVKVRDSSARVFAAAEDPSAAGDLALIFNYMKTLDPGSVVRESEFATAETAGSVPQRIWAKYNKVLEGERLAPDQRADFVDRTRKLFGASKRQHDQRLGSYKALARSYGLKEENITINLGQAPEPQIAPPPAGTEGWSIRRIE